MMGRTDQMWSLPLRRPLPRPAAFLSNQEGPDPSISGPATEPLLNKTVGQEPLPCCGESVISNVAYDDVPVAAVWWTSSRGDADRRALRVLRTSPPTPSRCGQLGPRGRARGRDAFTRGGAQWRAARRGRAHRGRRGEVQGSAVADRCPPRYHEIRSNRSVLAALAHHRPRLRAGLASTVRG